MHNIVYRQKDVLPLLHRCTFDKYQIIITTYRPLSTVRELGSGARAYTVKNAKSDVGGSRLRT